MFPAKHDFRHRPDPCPHLRGDQLLRQLHRLLQHGVEVQSHGQRHVGDTATQSCPRHRVLAHSQPRGVTSPAHAVNDVTAEEVAWTQGHVRDTAKQNAPPANHEMTTKEKIRCPPSSVFASDESAWEKN